ncbi:hypothetical protein KP509_20G020700 [Ceratopteris richardii]|nr:hypothetical protein KP509_20G020700 [Ceratopteris richardii]
MRFYKPLVGPTEGSFLHWAWVSKQFVVFGSLLQDSLASVSEAKSGSNTLPETQVTGRELHPSYYYQLAAHYMIQRRQSSQTISSTYGAIHEDVLGRPEETSPPLYVGQSSRICPPGAKGDARCPTDEEYMLHAVIEERLFPHSVITINLFKRAYELYKNIQAGRMGYFVACEMGREYFNARDYANAKQLFDSVAGMYRQEAWVSLLWTVLGFLRECARQMDHLREYIDYSLEMAALPPVFTGHKVDTFGFNQHGPAGPLCQSQRERISTEVIGLLRGEQTVLPSKDGQNGLTVVDSDPVCVNIDMASPLRAVFTACVAFHESTVKPGHKTLLTLSLFTRLPQRIDFQELEICFNQPKCNVILVKDAHEVSKDGFEVKTGFDLHLEPNKWTRFSFNLIPGQSGKLECLSVTAHLGALASIRCQVESPASREDVFYWKLEPQLEMMPLKDSALSNYGQKTIQIEDQDPVVDLVLETVVSPALVNELFPVVISVMPKGHPVHGGEIKFAITEASTALALTSPSLIPSVSLDTSSVELLIVIPSDDMDESLKSFSGILQVPEIATDGSFSTHIYMRWKKAMAVTLFATFSYQIEPMSASDSGYPSHSFIHRELQLQCEDPFTLSYRHMSPFRRGALLLGNLKRSADTEMDRACVPVDEITTLILTLENSSSVNLELISITVNDTNESLCLVRAEHTINGKVNNVSSLLPANQKSDFCCEPETEDVPTIRCGEIYSCLFYIQPLVESAALSIASICIKWRRLVDKNTKPSVDRMLLNSSSTSVTSMLSSLPSLQVEKPVMLAIFDSPPHAVLGVPIDICLKLQNLTSLPQEIDFSIIDSAGFILSGAHCSTVHLLPHAKDVVSCKLVPIASGPQQLPQFNLISKRYNAGFQQSSSSIQIFVFPSSMLAKNYNFLPS